MVLVASNERLSSSPRVDFATLFMSRAVVPQLLWLQSNVPALLTALALTIIPLKLRDRPRLAKISAAFVLVNILLQVLKVRAKAKRPKVVEDLRRVGRSVDGDHDFDEYDVVIVGGGKLALVSHGRYVAQFESPFLALASGGYKERRDACSPRA